MQRFGPPGIAPQGPVPLPPPGLGFDPRALPQIPSRLPSPIPPAEVAVPTDGGGPGGQGYGAGGAGSDAPDITLGIDQVALEAAIRAVLDEGLVLRTRPSPIDAIPFRGTVPNIFARKVIGPNTATGHAEATTAATALANAESSFGADTVQVVTPPTVDDFATVLEWTPEPGQAFVMRGVGVWAHDLRALRDLIRWRVTIAGRNISPERELGMIGSLDKPAFLYGVAGEGETIKVEAKNLDLNAPSLVEVAVFGWALPAEGVERLSQMIDPRG